MSHYTPCWPLSTDMSWMKSLGMIQSINQRGSEIQQSWYCLVGEIPEPIWNQSMRAYGDECCLDVAAMESIPQFPGCRRRCLAGDVRIEKHLHKTKPTGIVALCGAQRRGVGKFPSFLQCRQLRNQNCNQFDLIRKKHFNIGFHGQIQTVLASTKRKIAEICSLTDSSRDSSIKTQEKPFTISRAMTSLTAEARQLKMSFWARGHVLIFVLGCAIKRKVCKIKRQFASKGSI